MKTIVVSKSTAARVIGLINVCAGVEPAAHQCRVQLTAIRPYSDRGTELALAVLDRIATREGEKRQTLIDQVSRIAESTTAV